MPLGLFALKKQKRGKNEKRIEKKHHGNTTKQRIDTNKTEGDKIEWTKMERNKNGFIWNEMWKKDKDCETKQKRKIDQFKKWQITRWTEKKKDRTKAIEKTKIDEFK